MHRWAKFYDLPVELSERIVLLAARSYALDKAWLAQLARVSRAIHTLVQPILVYKIVVTSSNLSRLYATSGTFTSTRCIMVDDDIEDEELFRDFLLSSPELHSVDMFRGPIWALRALLKVSRPSRIIIPPALWRGADWRASPERLSQITHIRGVLSTLFSLLCIADPSSCTTHVIVNQIEEVLVYGSSLNLLIIDEVLIKFIRLPRLQRLCIAVVHDDQTELSSALSTFARKHRETRLWISRAQPEHDLYTVFHDESWITGQQLYCE
ncbi:hypothetical protein EXIGLDRAFT_838342 [Exidia glandulosa HHB12029]|uniref:F-box domain-containing protein n=1 Tax=Exidia glandulosa HHB12029 TaxID=1314781 RepID=A0A165FY55_EXIGL|nr:hypothetical protein EXIGLDRAFT_838342 [Exidia glandulosa HHB12029]